MRRILLMAMAVFLAFSSWAQERTVSGRVTSAEDGSALPGVNVVIKGTTTGTVTDVNGSYRLDVPSDGGTLVFSFIGLTTVEIAIGSRNVIDTQMASDVTQLSEIVVTGYGAAQDKKSITGSVAQVTNKDIAQVSMATFDQILQGKAPGVMISAGSGQPGTAANVRIRGIGSINGGTQPLYILDGVPITAQDFATLNPNDFENVNILKDAASTSIYGARAANGVIVITSKRGKEGAPKLNYSFQYGLTTRTNAKFDMMNTPQKIGFERLLFDNGIVAGSIGAILDDGSLTETEKEERIAELGQIDTDWIDVFFRTGKTQMHELSSSGSNGKTSYFLSANYRTEDGIIIRSKLDRYTLRFNFDHKVNEKLNFGLNSSMGYSESSFLNSEVGNSTNNPVLSAFISNPYTRVRNPETGEYEPGPTGFNLVEQMEESNNEREEIKVVSNIFLQYELLKGLIARTTWGIDYRQRFNEFRINRDAPNQGGIPGATGSLFQGYDRLATYIGTTTLQYSKDFGSNHSFRALVGQELVRTNQYAFNYTGYGLNDKLQSPAAITPGTNTNNLIPLVGGFNADNALLSYFFDGLYTLNNKYNFSVGLRRDGSSRFGANKRFAIFYAVGASWNISDEQFMQSLSFVNSLKLRSSYGTQGNQEGIGNFSYLGTFGSNFNYAGEQGIAPTQIGNPDYQWETTKSFNLGLDFTVLNNRISGSFEFYNDLTEDLFINTQLSRTSGFTGISRNVGVMRNRGFEISLNTENVKIGDFSWSTNLNITFNKNRIVDLFQEDEFVLGTGIVREGLPLGSHYVVEWAGVNPANGDPLYRDANGNVTNVFNADNSQAKFGTWDPPRFGGFTNTFRYKAVELSIFCSFQEGNVLFNNQRFFANNPLNFGGFNQSTEQLNAWTTPGQITNVPRVDAQRQFSSQDLEDASFLRVRNVLLSYTLPSKIASKAKLASVRVYAQGQNLFTFTKYSGFDPEDNNNVQLSQYPVPRSITFGVDLGF
ncbi:MAG: TonB-dependent receptor [Cytophagales bacterium]|nr:TonB-dependent receptor [Cytophagales bacterium]